MNKKQTITPQTDADGANHSVNSPQNKPKVNEWLYDAAVLRQRMYIAKEQGIIGRYGALALTALEESMLFMLAAQGVLDKYDADSGVPWG